MTAGLISSFFFRMYFLGLDLADGKRPIEAESRCSRKSPWKGEKELSYRCVRCPKPSRILGKYRPMTIKLIGLWRYARK